MKSIQVLLAASLFLVCSVALASWAPATLKEKTDGADVIAVVTISVTKGDQEDPDSVSAKIETAIKGSKKGERVTLAVAEGRTVAGRIPSYKEGETCLIFLVKMKNGSYMPYRSVFGKYPMKKGKVLEWGKGRKETIPIADAITEIDKLLVKKKKA